MAIERRRLCGFRKVGAYYLVGTGLSMACKKMPLELCTCPTCGTGVKQNRGFAWVHARALTGGPCAPEDAPAQCKNAEGAVTNCPFAAGPKGAGILWVGRRFYNPEAFIAEARNLGVSKRLHVPVRAIEMGKTWVMLAHKDAVSGRECKHLKNGLCLKQPMNASGSLVECLVEPTARAQGRGCTALGLVDVRRPGIFYAFRPDRYELLVTKSQFEALTPEAIEAYDRRHIKLVVVPDDDRDHQGTVWDEESEA